MSEDRDIAKVREAIAVLEGHFDTVQIFCTRVSPREGGTIDTHDGSGNWFARFGQVAHWIATEQAMDNHRRIRHGEAE